MAVAALVVLWVTIKLAGRKPASDDDDEDEDALPVEPAAEEHTSHAHTSSNVG